MRGRLLALGITAAAFACTTAGATARSSPRLTLTDYCPVVNGQQRYGVEAVATGVPPGAIFFWFWSYRPLPGETGGNTSDAVGSGDDDVVGPFRLSFDRPMKYIEVGLYQAHPAGPESLVGQIKKPCKHADK